MLTVGALQLGHGGHEGALGHVALYRGHERLLVGGVQWLGELDWLQGGQAAAHAVDDGHTLCLSGGQTWCKTGRESAKPHTHHSVSSLALDPLRDTLQAFSWSGGEGRLEDIVQLASLTGFHWFCSLLPSPSSSLS